MNSTHFNRSQVLSSWRIQWPALRRATEALAASLPIGAVVRRAADRGLRRARARIAARGGAASRAGGDGRLRRAQGGCTAAAQPVEGGGARKHRGQGQAGRCRAISPTGSGRGQGDCGAAQGDCGAAQGASTAPATPSAAAPTKIEPSAAAPAKPQAAAPLDLKSLETRLKETKAIGVFTKLTLKNQVDDLLDRFRAFYQGEAQDHAGRTAAVVRYAGPEGARAAAGRRPAAGQRDRGVARIHLGHSVQSREVRDGLADATENAREQSHRDLDLGRLVRPSCGAGARGG